MRLRVLVKLDIDTIDGKYDGLIDKALIAVRDAAYNIRPEEYRLLLDVVDVTLLEDE
jgi:hypothetical protein